MRKEYQSFFMLKTCGDIIDFPELLTNIIDDTVYYLFCNFHAHFLKCGIFWKEMCSLLYCDTCFEVINNRYCDENCCPFERDCSTIKHSIIMTVYGCSFYFENM